MSWTGSCTAAEQFKEMSRSEGSQLWGGRFNAATNSALIELNRSLPVDSRLFADDIDGSKAYARALERASIITAFECDTILKHFELIRFEWIEGEIKFKDGDEDVHTVNERRLTELCGEAGQKIHTGRSRNDQVATDMRLWMKKAVNEISGLLVETINALIELGAEHKDVKMPGYTHLQRAQPVSFAHWALSHAFALKEDCGRLEDLLKRVDVLPLGSGAIAGNPLGIDREYLAKLLNFSKVSENSMHTVADRDFEVEFVFACATTSLHLSRFAEDLIIFSTKEFDFVTISEMFTTGSSLMPQKRNPDSMELIRGSAGVILGSLVGLMTTIKGLPSTYNKDLQFDKKYVFDTFDLLFQILQVANGVAATLTINRKKCEDAISDDMMATEVAYGLVRKGIPFRKAHELTGRLVSYAEEHNESILKIPSSALEKIDPAFEEVIKNIGDVTLQYNSIGGTAPTSVAEQIRSLRDFVNSKLSV